MLALYDLSVGGYICGASIISDRWALSAGKLKSLKCCLKLHNQENLSEKNESKKNN